MTWRQPINKVTADLLKGVAQRPILDYFAPLAAWLDEQNDERSCGW